MPCSHRGLCTQQSFKMQLCNHGHIDGSVHSRALVVQSWSHRGLCAQQKFKM